MDKMDVAISNIDLSAVETKSNFTRNRTGVKSNNDKPREIVQYIFIQDGTLIPISKKRTNDGSVNVAASPVSFKKDEIVSGVVVENTNKEKVFHIKDNKGHFQVALSNPAVMQMLALYTGKPTDLVQVENPEKTPDTSTTATTDVASTKKTTDVPTNSFFSTKNIVIGVSIGVVLALLLPLTLKDIKHWLGGKK